MQEVELLSERQEVLADLVMSKRDMQKNTQKYQEKVFEEFKELEEPRTKDALELVKRSISLSSGKPKGKEQECCKDCEDRGR